MLESLTDQVVQELNGTPKTAYTEVRKRTGPNATAVTENRKTKQIENSFIRITKTDTNNKTVQFKDRARQTSTRMWNRKQSERS